MNFSAFIVSSFKVQFVDATIPYRSRHNESIGSLMKLYSVAFTARRVIEDQIEIRINPLLIIQETQEAAFQEGSQIAASMFPLSEGWLDHQMVWLEIEQGMFFDDGRRLTWQLEEPQQDTEVSNG
jgi:hypothetical protein